MRKVLISFAAAASALAVATPASAQIFVGVGQPYGYQQPYGYGYNQPYGYGYGYNNYGQVRALQYRVDSIQQQINILDRRNILSNREARRLRNESRDVENRLHRAARYGLNPNEARNVQWQIARLEQQVRREANDRDGRWGRNGAWGYNGYRR